MIFAEHPDSGGTWGCAEMLGAIGDPTNKRHAEFTQWAGAGSTLRRLT